MYLFNRVMLAAMLVMPGAAMAQSATPAITFGEFKPGDLAAGDPVDHRRAHYDCRNFSGRSGQMVQIVMRSVAFDARVALHKGADCQGDWQDSDNDSGLGYGDAELEAALDQTGVWSIRATSYEPGKYGAYHLGLALANTPTAQFHRGDALPIRLGEKRSGALSIKDPALAERRFFNCYRLTVAKPVAVAIEVMSDTIEPSLTLFRGGGCRTGNVLGGEAGAAGKTSSKVLETLPAAGFYTIRVSSWRPRKEGSYTLTVSPAE